MRDIPNYCSSASASRALANRIMQYYHNQGFHDVRAWVERDTKVFKKPLYVVRTNIRFTIPERM